ncbi:MAG: FAD-binding oxidoreductase, partial [Muribaculaceae bacterium]|nr:FAD-binding oxidoreductase [Muribaculaceae bacterium]
MKQNKYDDFVKIISRFIDRKRIFTDDLRRIAWGADAGFYHLTPQVVVNTANEYEVEQLLKVASSMKIPVTFRAAGTSLSGQSISDSVLVIAGKNWEDYTVSPDASTITMQPAIIGIRVNDFLKPYDRIFTPDPASKNSAMVGGIV